MRIEGDARGDDGDYDATARWAYTLALIVAMAMAAKTVEWVWRPTTGTFRMSRAVLMALVKLLPQLRPLGF